MNNASFKRKLTYIIAIVALLVPVYFLGQPMVQKKEGQGQGGGTLAKIRQKYGIGQADIGEIDPASESARLATLGFRGFATTILWYKADYYKREHFWDRYSATLNQIALLQPHFLNVWDHQAHNLTYNIAVEFDGYKQRYEWVKKGIDYLIRGTTYNKRQPILQWTLGIYTGQKIGISDEKRQYRELYRNDEEYHKHLIDVGLDVKRSDALGADGKPDHWLTGRLWFLKGYDLFEAGCYCKKSPHLFYSDGPKCQLRYSEAIEDEGVLDDRAQFSWSRAGNQWREFGNIDLMTTWGHPIKMKGDTAANATVAQAKQQLMEIAADVRTSLIAKIRGQLSPELNEALDTDPAKRTQAQAELVYNIDRPLEPTPMEIAEASPKAIRDKAIALATKLKNAEEYLQHLLSYKQQVNYDYWETRAVSEQYTTTLEARQRMYNADKLLQEAKLDQALLEYDKAWLNWARVFRRFPALMSDDVAGDIMKSIRRYRRILDAPLPESFPLYRFHELKTYAEKNLGDPTLDRWIDAFKAAAPSLPENDDLLPANLNDATVEFPADLSNPQPAKASENTIQVETPESGEPPSVNREAASSAASSAPGRAPAVENPN